MRASSTAVVSCLLLLASSGCAATAASPPSSTPVDVKVGRLSPGPHDAITDVAGVRVGHVTLTEGQAVRTGVTAILPHGGNLFRHKVPAALVVANGFGKFVGATQVDELGQLETPILLTNTLAVWDAARAVAEWTLAQPGNEQVRSVNPVVAETNDGWLNDIRSFPLERGHFLAAIEGAEPGPVEQGSVGAGTGTRALGYKGGIGTASRVVDQGYVVGVLVQTNFGGTLTVDGVALPATRAEPRPAEAGSCVIVIATDAPLDARQLRRLASRSFAGMARTGASFSHGSGDYAFAFSTHEGVRIRLGEESLTATIERLDEARLSPLFLAVADATQAAIYASLLAATSVEGREGHRADALDAERLPD